MGVTQVHYRLYIFTDHAHQQNEITLYHGNRIDRSGRALLHQIDSESELINEDDRETVRISDGQDVYWLSGLSSHLSLTCGGCILTAQQHRQIVDPEPPNSISSKSRHLNCRCTSFSRRPRSAQAATSLVYSSHAT